MKTLCFAEYAKIIIEATHQTNESVVKDLLDSIVEEVGTKDKNGLKYEADKKTVNELLNRTYNVNKQIVSDSDSNEVRKAIVKYFDKFIVSKILEKKKYDTIHKLKTLISGDDTISLEQKKELLAVANKDTLAEFLSSSFLYSLTKPNKLRIDNNSTSKYLPHLQNRYFTGREEKLDLIEKNFQSGDRVSLVQSVTGLGGIGKSSIALEYAYKHFYKYETIWWINAKEERTVLSAYTDFCLNKGIIMKNAKPEKIIAAVQNWFNNESNKNWLFIYDNADADDFTESEKFPKGLEHYLPQKADKGHVIITTRSNDFPQSKLVNIDVFTEDEAIRFLKKRTEKEGYDFSTEQAKRLAHRLGYFPLALEQAGAYIFRHSCTMDEYIDKYNNYKCEMLHSDVKLTHYQETVYKTWRISIEQIKSEAAIQLFNMCVYFVSDAIPIRIFIGGREALPNPLNKVLQDINSPTFDNFIAELTQHSLVKFIRNESDMYWSMLSIHSLVQEVVRLYHKHEKNIAWITYAFSTIGRFFDIEIRHYGDEYTQPSQLCVDNVMKIAEYAEEIYADDMNKKEIGERIFNEIELEDENKLVGSIDDVDYQYKNYDILRSNQALKFFRDLLIVFGKFLGTDHPTVATYYHNIAVEYASASEGTFKWNKCERQRKLVKATELYKKVLVIRKRVYGNDSLINAHAHERLARIYRDNDDSDNALKFYNKALALYMNLPEPPLIDIETVVSNIACIYNKRVEHDHALKFYDKAVKFIYNKCYSNKFSESCIERLESRTAEIYYEKGEYTKALECHNRELKICKKVHGHEHLDVAHVYENIAWDYIELDNFEKALEYLNRALEICEKNHLEGATLGVAHLYAIIGRGYNELDNYENALKCYSKALEIFEKIYKYGHSIIKKVKQNIKEIIFYI